MRIAILCAVSVPIGLIPILRFVGAAEGLSVLSGTVPGTEGAIVLGLAYAATWFCACAVSPIIALAIAFDTYLTPGCQGPVRHGFLPV